MFKKKKGIKLTYEVQGLIYFTCITYRIQPEKIKKQILNLCTEAAGEDFAALFAVLTDNTRTLERIAADFYISPQKLTKYRKLFFETWNEKYLQNCR